MTKLNGRGPTLRVKRGLDARDVEEGMIEFSVPTVNTQAYYLY